MNIFDFQNFVINESVAEAKSIINKFIQTNQLDSSEFTNSKSGYNQIKDLLQKNPGYTGYFVRQHYENGAHFTHLEDLYNKLLRLKEFKMNINLQEYNSKPLSELVSDIDRMLASKQDVPGLVLHEDPATKALSNFIKKSNYRYILCVKKVAGNWVPDHNAMLWWGSPRWCLKSESTFSCSYAKTPNHLQYVIIHKNFIDEVKNSASQGRAAEFKAVPRNYNLSTQDSSNYHSENVMHRIGVTTSPIDKNQNPFSGTQSTSFPKQNDNNNGINRQEFDSVIEPIKFEMLDMAARNLLNVERSQFDTVDYGLQDLLTYVKMDFSHTADKDLTNTIKTMYDVIKKHISSELFQKKILPDAMKMMEDDSNTFQQLHYLLYFVKNIPNQLLLQFRSYYGVDDLEELPVNYTFSVFQIFIESLNDNSIQNEEIIKLSDDLMAYKYIQDLLKVKASDNLAKPTDFKTMMLKTYNNQKAVRNYIPVGTISLDKITKMLSDYLFLHKTEKGEAIIKDKQWDSEQEFALRIIAKNKIDSKNSYSGSDDEFIHLFNTHIHSFDNDKNTFLTALRGTTNKEEYDVTHHNSCVRSAMNYYMSEINPAIKEQL